MENTNRIRTRLGALTLAVCLSLAALPALAAVTLRVVTNDGVPGGELTLTLSLVGGSVEEAVASAQLDLTFETAQLQLAGACNNGGTACQQSTECGDGRCQLRCTKDDRLDRQDFNATFPEFQNLPSGQRKVRLRLLAPIQGTLPLPTFDDGVIATCTLGIPTGAGLGGLTLSASRVEVGDGEGDTIDATVEIIPGNIVSELPTVTPTTGLTATPTVPATETNTVEPTETRSPTARPPDTASPTVTRTSVATVTTPVGNTPTVTSPPTTRPADTATPVPTNTRTQAPTSTPTTVPTTKKKGGNGCNVTASSTDFAGLPWLALPLGLLWMVRRRS